MNNKTLTEATEEFIRKEIGIKDDVVILQGNVTFGCGQYTIVELKLEKLTK